MSESRVQISLLLTIITASFTTAEVCYKPFGCFNQLYSVPYYPDPPEKIAAKFRVYTLDDPDGNRYISYHDDLNYSLFNETTSVGFLIHGWLGNGQRAPIRKLYSPLVKYYNVVISVDWSSGAVNPSYRRSVANTQLTGREIAHLLHILHEKRQINLEKVCLIGFSLGAHVAGLAGRWLKQQYGLDLGRITGK